MEAAQDDHRVEIALAAVKMELDRAVRKFRPSCSLHEALAILEEEVDELRLVVHAGIGNRRSDPTGLADVHDPDPVRSNVAQNHRRALTSEAVQVAAMAVRFILDLELDV